MNEELFQSWTDQYSVAARSFLECFKPVFSDPRMDPKLEFVLGNLSTSCSLTSDSAAFLVRNERLWDADILVRSVLEGTIKFLYLCVGDEAQRHRRAEEYWDHLPEIARFRRHRRASIILEMVPDRDAMEWRPLVDMCLPEQELREIEMLYPRKERRALEQKWSFSELVASLAMIEEFKDAVGLLYTYGMSSHTIHQDGDGIALIWDRERRSDERRITLERAHAARELGDLLSMAFLRTLAAYRVKGIPLAPVWEVYRAQALLLKEFDSARVEWQEIEYGDGAD